MSESLPNEEKSAIRGTGHGSKHLWERGFTGPSRTTHYLCKRCNIDFYHHYPSTPNIFEAMAKAGIPDECAPVSALENRDGK